MLDDKIEWKKNVNLKDFEGFDIRKNGKQNGYDVFGLLKSSRMVWLKVGYLTLRGYDLRSFLQLFMFVMVFTIPLFYRFVWL